MVEERSREEILYIFFFFFKQKTAYEMLRSLVGSEMCIRDSSNASLGLSDEWLERAQKLFPKPQKQPQSGEEDPPEHGPPSPVPESPEPKTSPVADTPSGMRKQVVSLQAQLQAAKTSSQLAKEQLRAAEQKLSVAEAAKTKWSTYAGKMVQERKDAMDMCAELKAKLELAGQQLTEQRAASDPEGRGLSLIHI
eukprot:TRINITY_DN60228_c0_g1_i2.p1 TRINITY_DN60228_c0_g1~~TRINITY_DN60228_c0_g1_i2.p1  ORF type:complete len:194 (-),score=66.33 TRINITY_DN60228_c0_g1_i2:116-697(-)